MKGPNLKGKKVILKPINIKEAANYLRWINDREVNRFLIIDGQGLTLSREKKYIKKSLISKDRYNWAIYTKEAEHIGTTALHDIEKNYLKASWGIFIGEKSYWNQGLGTDTLKTVLKFAFTKLKLNRVQLYAFSYNPRGIRCYKKCGFKIEGRTRQAIKKNGKFIDEIIMGITKSDYKKLRNK